MGKKLSVEMTRHILPRNSLSKKENTAIEI